MSGYLGSIGFAFPAAMGAWAAVGDDRQVVAVAGDGGFGQYAMEFTTAVKYGMNITLILLVNEELGKISKEQRGAMLDVWQTSLHNPDFAAFAENSGGMGVRVREVGQLNEAIRTALDHDGPALVQIDGDPLLV
jgi:thiamine pyrophosphate-dependent acetolactate synthase large subunit-like protein